MLSLAPSEFAVLAALGVAAGLWLLARGFAGYRQAARIADTSTSRIATLAIGEVRVAGVVEPAEMTLVSPLQSAPCVYYDASVTESRGEDGDDSVFEEMRAVGFRVRDPTGSVRIFPRDARFDVPLAFDERTGILGDEPPGLHPRSGSAYGSIGELSREAQVAALLTVRPAGPSVIPRGGWAGGGSGDGLGVGSGSSRRYREARLAPGDPVTVVGQVLPFDQLADPASADLADRGSFAALDDPEVAASLAEARAAGTLAATPEEAWGNAAIPGFGIGQPVRAPEIHPEAHPLPLATPEAADRAERTFDIRPHDLVLAAAPHVPLTIGLGTPDAVVARHEGRFLVGLLGAALAIGSAVVLALAVTELLG